MTIYYFGNALRPDDTLPRSVIQQLKQQFPAYAFIHADPTENWWRGEKKPVIIDTIEGLQRVTIFRSLDRFEKPPFVTPHDYDLYTDLMLMRKIGKINSFTLIGVPQKSNSSMLVKQLTKILSNL